MDYAPGVEKGNKYLFAFLALFIIPLTGLSIDIYVPSLPAIAQYFKIDNALVQLTITSYMLGLGLMQLFAGGISDSFGRKKPCLIGMFLYVVSSLGIPFLTNIYQLLFLRFIQGVLVAAIAVPLRSVIADLFEGRELYKMMTYMTMAWSIGPIIAPAIGGYFQHYIGWKANFYFLTVYGLLGFILVLLFLPETSFYRHPFRINLILKRYREILFHWDFLSGLIINGLLYSILIFFSVVGPFLIQNVLHYSAVRSGHMALLVGLAWFLGGFTNRFLVNISLDVKAEICFWSMLFISLLMVLLAVFLPMDIYTIMVPLFFLTWLGGILFPNYFARGISLFPKTTGSSNALFAAFVVLISGSSSGFATLLKSENQLPLTMAYVGLISLCLMVFYIRPKHLLGENKRRYSESSHHHQ